MTWTDPSCAVIVEPGVPVPRLAVPGTVMARPVPVAETVKVVMVLPLVAASAGPTAAPANLKACRMALSTGQRARNCTGQLARLDQRETHRWWKSRKSSPSPPTSRCTIRVLASFTSSPRAPNASRNRINAASACARDLHITSTSSA